jgi:signal peptidase I
MTNDPVRLPPYGPASEASTRDATELKPKPGGRSEARPRQEKKPEAAGPKDATREIVECVVFVVVLVLLLKAFVAEAFVIPTGSMATTLLGYQKDVVCPKCHFHFPVNCSDQAEHKPPQDILGATCPNCRYDIDFLTPDGRPDKDNPSCQSGDRVLVAKYLYDSGLVDPQRLNVVVFKYPKDPLIDFVPQNYIKRLIGLPGETIGIRGGKLYVLKREYGLHYDDSGTRPEDLWQKEHMHADDPKALGLFEQQNSPFEIIRKPPDKILALRRIVYDNDHPAEDLKDHPRWVGAESTSGWSADAANGFQNGGRDGDKTDWLRYRHILRQPRIADGSEHPGVTSPELITDFLGYNAKHYAPGEHSDPPRNWVGDLMLECEVTIDKPQGELVFELSKGVDRFRCRWSPAEGGLCTLSRITGDKEVELERQPTAFKKPGTYQLRFANVDDRLAVWVGSELPFGNGRNYEPSAQRGPTVNDLQPASIGVRGGASVRIKNVKLWRDTYYTVAPDGQPNRADVSLDSFRSWSDPEVWGPLRNLPAKTLYVQPGHYLCMGDNSPESSDGRTWGLVPARLLLGRALVVYWPVTRAGTIK